MALKKNENRAEKHRQKNKDYEEWRKAVRKRAKDIKKGKIRSEGRAITVRERQQKTKALARYQKEAAFLEKFLMMK